MAIPLTLGMSVNVAFILAAISIPGLWGFKEWLFPFALLAMTAVPLAAWAPANRLFGLLMAPAVEKIFEPQVQTAGKTMLQAKAEGQAGALALLFRSRIMPFHPDTKPRPEFTLHRPPDYSMVSH